VSEKWSRGDRFVCETALVLGLDELRPIGGGCPRTKRAEPETAQSPPPGQVLTSRPPSAENPRGPRPPKHPDPVTSESPFSPVFTRAAFLETVGGGEVLRRLDSGLGAREPFLLLTGEAGTGKTTLVHEAIARWDSRVTVALLAYPTLTEQELLEEIVLRFGGEPADGASRPRLMACLERCLTDIADRGQTAMIVVDDAQRVPPPSLGELCRLVNAIQQARLPLEVLLVGSAELEALVEGPTLAALRERLSVRAKLEPLSSGETRRYLRHRTSVIGEDGAALFPRKTCLEIAAMTGGVPRRINALAGEALRIARDAGGRTITADHLRAATDTLAGTIKARAADEPDDEERAPSPNATDALTDAQTTTPLAAEPPAARPKRSTPNPEPTAHSARSKSPTSQSELSAAEEVPATPASHDAEEWVSRFVGDQGPIRIGSQVMAMPTSAIESELESEPRPGFDAAPPEVEDEPQPTASPRGRPRARSSRSSKSPRVVYALTAIAMFSAITLVIRSGFLANGSHNKVVADAVSAAPRPSVMAVSEPRRRSVITRVSRAAASDSGRVAGTVVVTPTRRYTIAIGEFADLQSAFDERDRIQELTRMDTWVVPATNDGELHRIVLGIYRSQERAEAAANMLLDSRTLDVATVVALPKRSARQ
jgi:MSHA biogenesis protein MshM